MLKAIGITLLTISLSLTPLHASSETALADVSIPKEAPASDDMFAEEEEEFPTGRQVHKLEEDPQAPMRKTRYRNWALAAGLVIIGIVTLILVGKNHKK